LRISAQRLEQPQQAEGDRLVQGQRTHPLRLLQRDLQRHRTAIGMADQIDRLVDAVQAGQCRRRIDAQAVAAGGRPGWAAPMAVQVGQQQLVLPFVEQAGQRAPLGMAAAAGMQAQDGPAAAPAVQMQRGGWRGCRGRCRPDRRDRGGHVHAAGPGRWLRWRSLGGGRFSRAARRRARGFIC
jgi:hypothetical protein